MTLFINIFGGLGLFLLGMWLMTDGLKLAAGDALRRVLRTWTNTPLRSLFSGFAITSLIQSSSAVTVATIGFVNAGILGLRRSIGIIYGSNIGTTTTAWVVAVVGFHVNIKALALPLIGVGMLLRLLFPASRKSSLGEALAGFGVFFLGIEILKSAFVGLEQQFDFSFLGTGGAVEHLMLVAVGFLFTVMMQSSSAAIAIILTASAGGILTMTNAAAAVIGANVGTTSTAMLAVIGATSKAKRVASAHVFFNVLTGLVAFALLPALHLLVEHIDILTRFQDNFPMVLAGFHTAFNVMGVALIFPFTGLLTRFLSTRFHTMEEDEARPKFLDDNIMATPALALDALALELQRLWSIAKRMVFACMEKDTRAGRTLLRDEAVLDGLATRIGRFTGKLQKANLPSQVADSLPVILRVVQYFLRVGELAVESFNAARKVSDLHHPTIQKSVESFHSTVAKLITTADPCHPNFSAEKCNARLAEALEEYHSLKNLILAEGAKASISIDQMSLLLERYSHMRRLLEQSVKGMNYIASLKPDVHAICPQ